MKKNIASQSIGAEMITAADGTAFTGTVSVFVTIDNGTQAAGAGTAPAHEGNGYHSYTPTQAETNGDHIAFTFTGTGAIPVSVQVFTTFPQTGDNFPGVGDIQSRLPAALISGRMSSDVGSVSGDTTAADNLELQYDGTGLTGDTFPSTQAQVGNIATGTSAIGANAGGVVITTGTETGTYVNTQSDGPLHIVEDVAGNTDFYYTVTLPGNGVLSAALWTGYIQSNADTVDLQFYDWGAAGWVTERTLIGANGTTQIEELIPAVSGYTGTGANIGEVRFRFLSTTTTAVATNRLIFEYATNNQSIGYANGSAWLDTTNGTAGTVPFVNAVADNPGLTLSEVRTICDALNIGKISAVALSAYTIDDDYSTFEIGGVAHQMTASGAFNLPSRTEDAAVTGTSTGTTAASFIRCAFVGVFSYSGQIFCDQATLQGGIVSSGDNLIALRNLLSTAGSYVDVTAGVNKTHYLQGCGAIELRGLASGDTVYFSGDFDITLAASCTGGTVYFNGALSLTNNGSGMTLIETSRVSTDIFASSAELGVVDNNVDAILQDTSVDIPAQIAALNDFDPATDTVANVTLVDTTTSNTDMRGTDGALLAVSAPTNFGDLSITASTGLTDITQAAADKVWGSSTRTLTDGIQKNQAFANLEFLMVLASDHVTPAAGLTVTGQRSVDGGAFVAIAGTIAEVSAGIYQVDLAAADTNGDVITYRFSSATADDTFITVTTS